jgi:ABC-type branched-subunit amino acid transport system ATPase component
MLKIENLNAGYNDLKVLQDVSLEIQAGEIVALMGPNGAGKSTLLKSIFNLTNITGGKIWFEDKNIVGLKPHELSSLGIYYLPQGRINFNLMTVKENLEIPILREDQEFKAKKFKQIFEEFPDLRVKQHQLADSLSGGQQQMLALGRAMMRDPELLLLDEPSLGLSPKLIKETFEKIKELNQKYNVTIVVVEHNIKSVLEICHRGLIMANGQVVVEDQAKKLLASDAMNQVFLGGME